MVDYEQYIKRLRNEDMRIDYSCAYNSILAKTSRRQPAAMRLVFAGALAALIISISVFGGYPLLFNANGSPIESYVFQKQGETQSSIIAYVFVE